VAEDTCQRTGETVLEAEEYMDDGTPIVLKVTLDKEKGSALCDFT
jgi:5-oxoprolinase (ATP-hydrolysing)